MEKAFGSTNLSFKSKIYLGVKDLHFVQNTVLILYLHEWNIYSQNSFKEISSKHSENF